MNFSFNIQIKHMLMHILSVCKVLVLNFLKAENKPNDGLLSLCGLSFTQRIRFRF